ncbi:non-homologous end joining protein Ku [Chelatococcus reniformis]|uniref:Non-homologous end joining protein Ku n=1 Tax=Chelatococcus reniformis TaxID=1494448 RepID=A0A916XBD6_9HYPH|nr:non-homologous end joining protein Ku [Chelatococcus reniformis]
MKVGELTCPVALYTAASTSDRITLHTLNRETGHRVRRQFVDEESGEVVPPDDQVKGFPTDNGSYVIFQPEEIAAVMPESQKTLDVEAFVPAGEVDRVFFDKPYFLAPSGPGAEETYGLLRDCLESKAVVAVARAVLFRRVRTVLVQPFELGLLATTLNFDYEVRSAKEAFDGIPKLKIEGEMLELAKHIISTKSGEFDPAAFDDRYENALADLVRAKLEGKPLPKPKAPPVTKTSDLMEALRQSAGAAPPPRRTRTARPPAEAKPRAAAKAAARPASRRKSA